MKNFALHKAHLYTYRGRVGVKFRPELGFKTNGPGLGMDKLLFLGGGGGKRKLQGGFLVAAGAPVTSNGDRKAPLGA